MYWFQQLQNVWISGAGNKAQDANSPHETLLDQRYCDTCLWSIQYDTHPHILGCCIENVDNEIRKCEGNIWHYHFSSSGGENIVKKYSCSPWRKVNYSLITREKKPSGKSTWESSLSMYSEIIVIEDALYILYENV